MDQKKNTRGTETTPVMWSRHVQKMWAEFDRVLAASPFVKSFTLTPGMYEAYYSAIMPADRLTLNGNPKYRGVEIKKMGS